MTLGLIRSNLRVKQDALICGSNILWTSQNIIRYKEYLSQNLTLWTFWIIVIVFEISPAFNFEANGRKQNKIKQKLCISVKMPVFVRTSSCYLRASTQVKPWCQGLRMDCFTLHLFSPVNNHVLHCLSRNWEFCRHCHSSRFFLWLLNKWHCHLVGSSQGRSSWSCSKSQNSEDAVGFDSG